MICLALEFSSERRSVAIARGGTVLAEAVQQTESRATAAFALIEKVLADANISREEVELIAVGLGPGSYTGIRAAIALAQGWSLARTTEFCGVSSVEAIVWRAQAEKNFGRVNVAVNAQRGEFYLATWEVSAEDRREVLPLHIVPAAAIEARKGAGERFLGPEQEAPFFPSAAAVAELARHASRRQAQDLEPIYLRASDFVKAPPPKNI